MRSLRDEILNEPKKDELRPGLTIVMPVLNRCEMIEETLRSFEEQTEAPDEVIFVDNGSVDGSWESLYKWKEKMEAQGWKVRVKREVRPGAARARQTGLDYVETELVMFFDSDDTMHPDHIERIKRDFAENSDLDITAWSVTHHYPNGKLRKRRVIPKKLIDNHLVQGLMSTQAYALKTKFLRQAGGWDVSLGGWDDWELGLRLLLNNPRIKVDTESRADLRVQENSISGMSYAHRYGDWENTVHVMEQRVREMAPANMDHILRMLAYRKAILASSYKYEGYEGAAEELLDEALDCEELTSRDKTILKLAYKYTSKGYPGAGAIFAPHIS